MRKQFPLPVALSLLSANSLQAMRIPDWTQMCCADPQGAYRAAQDYVRQEYQTQAPVALTACVSPGDCPPVSGLTHTAGEELPRCHFSLLVIDIPRVGHVVAGFWGWTA